MLGLHIHVLLVNYNNAQSVVDMKYMYDFSHTLCKTSTGGHYILSVLLYLAAFL